MNLTDDYIPSLRLLPSRVKTRELQSLPPVTVSSKSRVWFSNLFNPPGDISK